MLGDNESEIDDNQDNLDNVSLSSDTLAILQSFLAEKKQAEDKFRQLKQIAHQKADVAALKRRRELVMDDFQEDWQLSQFWYDDETAERLAIEAINITPPGGSIACLSCPSVFLQLYKLLHGDSENNSKSLRICVFEYDRRFDVFGQDYIFFDFNRACESLCEIDGNNNNTDTEDDNVNSSNKPQILKSAFNTIIADPPFLSEECWRKTAEYIRWLSLPETSLSSNQGDDAAAASFSGPITKVIVCTGAVMGPLIKECVGCVLVNGFTPRHKGDRLSNEFGCFTNYSSALGDAP